MPLFSKRRVPTLHDIAWHPSIVNKLRIYYTVYHSSYLVVYYMFQDSKLEMYYRKIVYSNLNSLFHNFNIFVNVSKICTFQQKIMTYCTCSLNHQQIMYIFYCNHNYMYFLFHTLFFFCHL